MPDPRRSVYHRFTCSAAPQAVQTSYARLLLTIGIMAATLAAPMMTGALAASAVPAQTPLAATALVMIDVAPTSGQTIPAHETALLQTMPPIPDQTYNARFHEGSVELDAGAGFAGIDPFITGPVPK